MRPVLAAVLFLSLLLVHPVLVRPAMTGQVVTTINEIGTHYPLFVVTKSYHPENITVVYTKLDPHCHILPDRAHGGMPTLDFYWLMAGTHYKPMAGPLKDGIRTRLAVTDAPGLQGDPHTFAVRVDDLARVQHDLPTPTVQITAERHGEGCVARALLTLGPSDGQATMQLETIDTQTEDLTLGKKMQAMQHPEALQIYTVTVQGRDVTTGQPIQRTYPAPTRASRR
jgi:hypothetical protein